VKLTNKHNIPEVFFQAVQNDKYSRGGADYSATTLINSPRIVALTHRHWKDMEEDVSDRVWSLLGKAIHSILDSANMSNAIQEERIHVDILGKSVSGATDIYDANGVISDYKVTSVWTTIYGSRVPEWTEQLNIYGYLFRSIGFEVSALQIVAIYRDWSATEAMRRPDQYPQSQIAIVPIELWSEDRQREYITSRVQMMIDAEPLSDDELPPCSDDEMWAKPTTFAVIKNSNRRASKVCDTEEEAQLWIDATRESEAADKKKKSNEYRIEHRPGTRTRCERYCSVSPFCNIYQDYKETMKSQEDDNVHNDD
jgi:hypothetical protein